jgi:uncharacterized metal-binding protein YceD (DUF177 family)
MNRECNRDYIIPIKGISIGKHKYDFTIENSFFDEYENRDIYGANLNVSLDLDRSATLIELEAEISGVVRTECDRCLEEMEHKLDTSAKLIVKFVKSTQEEDNDEVMTIDPSESELDIKQFLYDYICLALPIQRVHNEGECDPLMIEKLEAFRNTPSEGDKTESPFGKLKDLIN